MSGLTRPLLRVLRSMLRHKPELVACPACAEHTIGRIAVLNSSKLFPVKCASCGCNVRRSFWATLGSTLVVETWWVAGIAALFLRSFLPFIIWIFALLAYEWVAYARVHTLMKWSPAKE